MVSVHICRIVYLILTTGVLAPMHKILISDVVLPISLKVEDGKFIEEEKKKKKKKKKKKAILS